MSVVFENKLHQLEEKSMLKVLNSVRLYIKVLYIKVVKLWYAEQHHPRSTLPSGHLFAITYIYHSYCHFIQRPK